MEIPTGDTCKERAEEYLQLLRIGITPHNSLLVRLLKEIKDGNLSFADIGTNEEELKNLSPA